MGYGYSSCVDTFCIQIINSSDIYKLHFIVTSVNFCDRQYLNTHSLSHISYFIPFTNTTKYVRLFVGYSIPVWACGRWLAEVAGSNPAVCTVVSCVCCMLSGRGLCDGPIARLEECTKSGVIPKRRQ
jgi:hypothetical protein